MAKTLQELHFKDYFMFSATMLNPENADTAFKKAIEADSVEAF